MAALSWVLYVLTWHRFLFMPVLVVLTLALGAIARRKSSAAFLPLGIGLGVVNVIWGPGINAAFVHANGVDAAAVVTSVEDTGNTYNDQQVERHRIAFRTPAGQSATGFFDDDDFNVFPAQGDGYSYPAVSEAFTLRYVPGAVKNFVIRTDDASPYARRVRCGGTLARLSGARRQWEFDPKNAEFARVYAEQLRAMLQQGCEAGPEARLEAERTLAGLERK